MKAPSVRALLVGLLLVAAAAPAPAQVKAKSDTLAARTDTVRRADSLKTAKDTTKVSGVDTVVNYTCTDSIVYSFGTRVMSMYTKAEVKHQHMALKAERIDVNWNTSIVHANGIRDTSDTTGRKYAGTPVMKDGPEDYKGFTLSYNFKTKKGKIDVGDTEIDKGYYHGEEIKKVDRDVMFVENGRYTTCDSADPHYYFYSPKMKVTLRDKIVAEPVYLYVADVPVFALPFGVFPNKGGRRSGIIAPAYGDDATRGKFLSHMGYYWAISDNMDANFRTDLYTKGGWALYSDYRYALRNYFNGSVSGEYKRLHSGEPTDPQRSEEDSYRLNIFHNQDIDPTSRLNVNFTFASNNSYLNTNDVQQALQQSVYSNATLSKYWEGTPNSITLNVSRSQNLRDGRIDETLPSLSFNHSQSYPFRSGKKTSDEEAGLKWYEMIGISYSAQAAAQQSKVPKIVPDVRISSGAIDTVNDFDRYRTRYLNQSFGIGISPKVGRFTVSPSFSYQDSRTFINNDSLERNFNDSSLVTVNHQESNKTGVLSTGVSVSTKFYGMAQPNMLGVNAFRHTVTPSLSFSYEKQILGADVFGGGKQMFATFNVSNNFEMKLKPESEAKEPKKVQLLNVGAAISYNFTADSLRLSPIGVNYRTAIGDLLNIGGNAGFDLYKLQEGVAPNGDLYYVRVNKFLLGEEHRLARLTNFSVSLSTSLSGERKKSDSGREAPTDTTIANRPKSGYVGMYKEEEPDFSIPWRLQLMFDYGENLVPPYRSRSSAVRGSLEFNLTENWKFSFNGGYDIANRQVVVPDINITRDLHCWIMNFSWTPIGYYKHYRVEIRVKAPQLQDLKVTKQGSDRGIY